MAAKLSSLTLSKRIPNWVSLNAHLSSMSCAINLQSTEEPDQSQPNSSDFDANIQILKNKLHPDSSVSLLGNTPDLNSSLNLFKWASHQKRFQHTAETYHMMILKLGMAGNMEEMEGFCNEMVREKCRGFDKSLLALIDSFVSNHRLNEALRVLYVMNTSSFKPSILIFNGLMCALVETKRDFKDVLFVYKEMVKAGIIPNVDTLNYLLEALFESGRVDTAIDQYRRMGNKGCIPNIKTFQILISGLASRDKVDEAVVILQEMFRYKCEPDYTFYTRMIPLFCSLQNLEIGLRLFKMMRVSNLSPDTVTYEAMITCLCEHLQMDDAVKLFEEMIDSSLLPDHQVYVDILNGFCKLNKFSDAENFLKERNDTDTCLHNILLGYYCDSAKFTMAKDMFNKMFEAKITDAESWNIFIRFLCENAVTNKALEYLCRMIVSSFCPDCDTYSALILGNCKAGNVAHALDLFHHVRLKHWILDLVSYAELVERLCERGNVEEAAKVYCYMSREGFPLKSTSFTMLIEKISVKRAIKFLSMAYSTGTAPLSATYNCIFTGLSKSDQENYLSMVLAQMIVIGCGIGLETYCSLIQCMSLMNQTRDCIIVLKLMLRDGDGLMPDSKTLACLLSCLSKCSQMNLILPLIDKFLLKSESIDSAVYNVLIDSLWREGYKNEASRLLDVMLGKGWVPDASTHALLMGSIAREETSSRIPTDEIIGVKDSVSCILEEGLGKA